MAGLDSFLLLAPILMLAVVALLVFVGCYNAVNVQQGQATNLQANPGIPAPGTRITPVDLTWDGDSNYTVWRAGSAGGSFENVGQSSSGAYTDATVTDGTTSFYVVAQGPVTTGDTPVMVTPQPPFVTGFNSLGSVLNDIFGFLGMAITVGGNPVTVYALGRLMVAGNNSTHEVRIVDATNNNVVASVIVNMAGGTAESFVYTALPTPVTLNANAEYYVVSLEEVNGDQWHTNSGTILATTNVATVTASVQGNGTTYQTLSPGRTYGPLDFLYL